MTDKNESVGIEYKFNVIKQQDADKYLSEEGRKTLDNILWHINRGRQKENKKLNSYWVCNQDEPYAEKVIEIILGGEIDKLQDGDKTSPTETIQDDGDIFEDYFSTNSQTSPAGIDVTGCEFFSDYVIKAGCHCGEVSAGEDNYIGSKQPLCTDNPNCLYKQHAKETKRADEAETILKRLSGEQIFIIKDKEFTKRFEDAKDFALQQASENLKKAKTLIKELETYFTKYRNDLPSFPIKCTYNGEEPPHETMTYIYPLQWIRQQLQEIEQ